MPDPIKRHKRIRIKATWPVIIFTEDGFIEAESRTITDVGLFIYCDKQLQKDAIYRMTIKLPEQRPIEVKGSLTLSNHEARFQGSELFGARLSFIKISEEDREHFKEAISAYSR